MAERSGVAARRCGTKRRGRCAIAVLLLAACLGAGAAQKPAMTLDDVAEAYVRLALALGVHDEDFVDAYHGPAEWREHASSRALPLQAIRDRAEDLLTALDGGGTDTPLVAQRRLWLNRHVSAIASRAAFLEGVRLSFDDESVALYDAVAPRHEAAHFEAILSELDGRLPGDGPLVERREAFRADFVIPPERLDAVFDAAIDECRRRTLAHIDLPDGESFAVEYVTDKPWSGYNWFQGDAHSRIQVNTDLPIHIDRAIDLACHEGYPGHHVYNTLLEQELLERRGWVEFSVFPLFSPLGLIAEGSANYGIHIAFPDDERIGFERRVLFPLAELDAARAAEYYEVERLTEGLRFAGNEAARRYLDGEIDADEAARWLMEYSLMSRERAEQRVKFIERYRSYVINYNLGEDLVAAWVEARAGDDPAARWRVFAELLSTPMVPSGLTEASE